MSRISKWSVDAILSIARKLVRSGALSNFGALNCRGHSQSSSQAQFDSLVKYIIKRYLSPFRLLANIILGESACDYMRIDEKFSIAKRCAAQ
jgi:hypothetical protein